MIKAEWTSNDALSAEQVTQTNAPNALNALDCISRQAAIDALMNSELGSWNNDDYERGARAQHLDDVAAIKSVPSVRKKRKPSAQPEVIPHRNYKYLSDYWCECGWHLGKKGEVKYCAECGRKVNWHG